MIEYLITQNLLVDSIPLGQLRLYLQPKNSVMNKILHLFLLIALPSAMLSQSVSLEVRAYSQGFYSPSISAMVPVADPLNFPGLCDTATIVLIDSGSGQSVHCDFVPFSVQGFGYSTLPSTLFGNSYLIGVRFRNTLHIFSKNTVLLDSLNKSIDLTQADNLCCSFDTTFGVASAYSGDVNHDGTIDMLDVSIIDNDRTSGMTGYVVTDLNGDQFVNTIDLNIASTNSNLFLFDEYFTSCLPTGTQSNQFQQIVVEAFPNPFSGKFTIALPEIHQHVEVVVTDLLGKIQYSMYFTSEKELIILTNHLLPGIHFVKVVADKKEAFVKLLSY